MYCLFVSAFSVFFLVHFGYLSYTCSCWLLSSRKPSTYKCTIAWLHHLLSLSQHWSMQLSLPICTTNSSWKLIVRLIWKGIHVIRKMAGRTETWSQAYPWNEIVYQTKQNSRSSSRRTLIHRILSTFKY